MANTTKLTHNVVKVTGLDADWSTPGDLPGCQPAGVALKAVNFVGAASDICIVKAGKVSQLTTSAAIATTSIAAPLADNSVTKGSFRREFNPPLRCWPFIDISDFTQASAASNSITMEFA